MSAFRPCAVIPTYDNPKTIAAVVNAVRAHVSDVIVVDDASHEPAASRIAALQAHGLAHVLRRATNGGKGAAVKSGLAEALARDFTHVVQIDADGQHAVDDIPRFLAAARERPMALVLGQPVFDASVPKARLYGRRVSVFWASIETFGNVVGDPLCGFRVYPVPSALAARARGDRMDFDPEIAVRMAWMGVPVVRLRTRVRYVPAAEGGVSHFEVVRDNLRISWIHTRLVFEAFFRLAFRRMSILPSVPGDGAAR